MKGPTAVLVAAVGVLFAMVTALAGSASLPLAGLLLAAIALLRADVSAGTEDDDLTEGERAGSCESCGGTVRTGAEYCEACATVGSWRK